MMAIYSGIKLLISSMVCDRQPGGRYLKESNDKDGKRESCTN